MTRIIIDAALRSKLDNLLQAVELCDESGRVLGRYVPLLEPSMYEGLEPQISDEELQRRKQQGGGRTLAEILADLEKRA
jgi:hypothetical protein